MTRTCRHCGAAIAAGARSPFCPDCRETASPWRVDEPALALACAHLGVDVRVRVRRMHARALRGRYHRIRLVRGAPRDMAVVARLSEAEADALMYHLVTIATRLTPDDASRALWHELTHAAQYERDPDAYVEGYQREAALIRAEAARTGQPYARAYQRISFETEAKANEGLHDDLFPLVRPNRRCSLPVVADHPFVVSASGGRLVLGASHERSARLDRAAIAQARERMAAR